MRMKFQEQVICPICGGRTKITATHKDGVKAEKHWDEDTICRGSRLVIPRSNVVLVWKVGTAWTPKKPVNGNGGKK